MKTTSRFAMYLFALLGLFLADCSPASQTFAAPSTESTTAGTATSTNVPATITMPEAERTSPVTSTLPDTPTPASAVAPSASYYVSPAGDDANPGTLAQPWRTIQKAADTLTAGESVYIRAGTYKERVIPQNSGSAGKIITYAAYPGETATIDGSGVPVPEDEGLFYIARQSYIRISGLRIVHSAYAGILVDRASYITIEKVYTYDSASSGIGVWGSHHLVIDSNEVELACSNGMQESLTVAGTDTFEVRYNHVHNGVAGYNKEGITIKDGASNGKVYGNHIHHTQAVGLYVDAWDKHTYNIDVYANVVHDIAASSGFSLASESGGVLEHIRLYNNIAYHNRYVGIWVSGCCEQAATHPMDDIWIVNNTLYDNGLEPWGGGIGLENPDVRNIVIRNNLVSQNFYFQIAVDTRIPMQTVTVDHNLIYGYRGTEGEIYGDDYVEGDPLFAAPASADFHILPGSPAIDAGAPAGAPADDFEGAPRPQDGDQDGAAAFDIGAYEFNPYTVRVYLPLVLKPL